MGYAVYHSEKGNISSGGIGNHIDRKKGMEHTFRHADPSRLHLNKNFKVHQDRHNIPLSSAIAERIKEGYKGKKAIRKDAVKYCTHILTGSHEQMLEIFSDKKKRNEWVKANFDFIAKEFGKENIVRFSLHLDERTPHIHAVTVPLTPDGRLSAKEMIGNKSKMQKRQDRYAMAMEPFGLHRGVKNTGIKHEDAKDYYKRINIENETEIKPPRRILGLFNGNDVMNQVETLKSIKNAFKQNAIETERNKAKVEELQKELHKEKQKYQQFYNNPNRFVQEVTEKKKQDKALDNLDFANRIAKHLMRNPDEINHERGARDKNYYIHKFFNYSTETETLDKEFILNNFEYYLDIDRKSGGELYTNIERLQRMSARIIKEREEKVKRTERIKKNEQKQEQTRRNRGFRR